MIAYGPNPFMAGEPKRARLRKPREPAFSAAFQELSMSDKNPPKWFPKTREVFRKGVEAHLDNFEKNYKDNWHDGEFGNPTLEARVTKDINDGLKDIGKAFRDTEKSISKDLAKK